MRYRLTPMTEGRVKRSAETDERRSRIIDAAMNRFSQHGYRATHVEDIAHEVGVAKGTVFLDFGSKEGLFLAAYQHAVQMLPAWLDAPEEVVRGPIDRFMRSEDPYGTLEFVEFGVRHGEIRDDVDPEMIASMLDWAAQRFQDALVSEDLDPGLIHRRPERRNMRIKEFVEILRGGIAASEATG